MLNYLDAYTEHKVYETINKCRNEMLEKWLRKQVQDIVIGELPKAIETYSSKQTESLREVVHHLNRATSHMAAIFAE